MVLVNQGIRAFRNLELEKAVELFENYRSLYPKGYDVTSRLAAAHFLLRGIREAPTDSPDRAAYLCLLWDSFEDLVKLETGWGAYPAELKGAFFSRVMEEVERCGAADSLFLPGDIPLGYVLLQAGRLEEAIQSIQASIRRAPHNAALYGYLGDAYWLRGKHGLARQCYREACLIDPAGIDWDRLQDEEFKDLRQDLQLLYGLDPGLTLAWLPSHARIDGLFERKRASIHDGLKELEDDYLALEKAVSKEKAQRLAAKLFFRGMILCENRESLKFIKKIDLIEVRRTMKEANPNLFADFMERIVEGEGSG